MCIGVLPTCMSGQCTMNMQYLQRPELQKKAVSRHVGGRWESNLGPPKEQTVLVTAESTLQPSN